MKRYQGLIIGLAASMQLSCSQAPEQQANLKENVLMEAPPLADAASRIAIPVAAIAQDSTTVSTASAPATAIIPAARLLIYHADVRLKTIAMPRATTRLDSLVRRSHGYLSAATETHADGEWRQETTIRVPPANFQALLNGLASLGTAEKKELSTNDVTAEHADVAARLQAKRAIEKQYTNLLNKAQKIKDILDIEEKLGGVREEIEATESRLRTLNSEVAYSTITLTLYQPIAQNVPDAPVISLSSRVVEAFYGGWQLLTSLLVGATTLWPLLLLGAGSWWLWQRQRRVRRVFVSPPAPPAA